LSLITLYAAHRDLHSFPTRRSSDLTATPPTARPSGRRRRRRKNKHHGQACARASAERQRSEGGDAAHAGEPAEAQLACPIDPRRSEEHTSELQSLTNLVCRLLLEKK